MLYIACQICVEQCYTRKAALYMHTIAPVVLFRCNMAEGRESIPEGNYFSTLVVNQRMTRCKMTLRRALRPAR